MGNFAQILYIIRISRKLCDSIYSIKVRFLKRWRPLISRYNCALFLSLLFTCFGECITSKFLNLVNKYKQKIKKTECLEKHLFNSLGFQLLLKSGTRPWTRTLDTNPEKVGPKKSSTLKNLGPIWTMEDSGSSWMQEKD